MADKKEYIERGALGIGKANRDLFDDPKYADGWNSAIEIIETAPAADVVSRGVLEQVKWERDMAMKQLEEHGIPFCGVADDVVKVVRCKDCKHSNFETSCSKYRCGYWLGMLRFSTDFCSYGIRKEYSVPFADEVFDAVEVVEVVHGHWIIKTDDYDNEYMMCSCCKDEFYPVDADTVDFTPNYCQTCGAKMDATDNNVGDKEEEET